MISISRGEGLRQVHNGYVFELFINILNLENNQNLQTIYSLFK